MLNIKLKWTILPALFVLLAVSNVSFGAASHPVPKRAIVTTKSRVKVKAAWLRSLLLKEVKSATKNDSAKVEVFLKEPWEDVALKRRPVSYRLLPVSRIRSGRVARMRVELFGKRGRLVAGVWVSGTVSIRRIVWTAKRDIAAGEVLTEDDMAKEHRDERQAATGSVEDPGEILGMSAKRSILAGTVLRGDQFKKRILVRRGQKVSILLSKGPIRVVAPGKILEKGGAGDLVRVLNTGSSRTITARVSDAGTVLVEY